MAARSTTQTITSGSDQKKNVPVVTVESFYQAHAETLQLKLEGKRVGFRRKIREPTTEGCLRPSYVNSFWRRCRCTEIVAGISRPGVDAGGHRERTVGQAGKSPVGARSSGRGPILSRSPIEDDVPPGLREVRETISLGTVCSEYICLRRA